MIIFQDDRAYILLIEDNTAGLYIPIPGKGELGGNIHPPISHLTTGISMSS